MKDAIVAAIPPEVLEQYEDLKTAVREAGETYDELKEKSKQAGETVAGVTQIPEIKAGGVVIDKKQSKEEIANAKKLENSMKGLTDRLLPLKAAKEKYKQETELLNKALLEGKITTTEFGIAMTNLNKEYQDFLDSNSEGTKTWMDGWREATDEYVKRARDASSNAKELFTTATQGMEDAIVGFVKTGKLSFRSLLSDIAEQLLRSQIRQLLANTFGGGGSSPSIFGIKIPGFANGGFLPAGQVGIVGEKGPEFITGPANITPMGGSMGNVTYNINAVDAPSFQSLVARDPGFIHAVAMQGARSL
jgi:phage-related minor tail protein